MKYRNVSVGRTQFVIDGECDFCRENLIRIEAGELDNTERVLFSPDLNASNKRMYWHIQIFDKNDPNVSDMKVKELY